jgi:hypothetical protein
MDRSSRRDSPGRGQPLRIGPTATVGGTFLAQLSSGIDLREPHLELLTRSNAGPLTIP